MPSVNATPQIEHHSIASRARRFWQKPWREKVASIRNRWEGLAAATPVPIRLPFGAWWISRGDDCGTGLRSGTFETPEAAFVYRYLRPGMIVLDIGAHHGFYSLLASKRVGQSGRVHSFEPSPRERRRLRFHIALNLCDNVSIHPMALGGEETESDLYVVQGSQTGCNSLRPPEVMSETVAVRVRVAKLDVWAQTNNIATIDFMKLDVEGAELEVLRGGESVLRCHPRPLVLCELENIRTLPWGHTAIDVATHLKSLGFAWFHAKSDGSLLPLADDFSDFDGNFIAIPRERIGQVSEILENGLRSKA
jgi:FkbM family methyltransferase